eukprot:scaffold77080_cov34-Phaeocystis_antarctica.AAC.1
MVAAVAQLHAQVVEGGPADGALGPAQQQPAVLLEEGAVARLLKVGDVHADEGLAHRRQAQVDVPLGPPQQVRPQQRREPAHLLGRVHVSVALLEGVGVAEARRVEQVEHRPQLAHVVLQRRACERELVLDAQRVQDGEGLG